MEEAAEADAGGEAVLLPPGTPLGEDVEPGGVAAQPASAAHSVRRRRKDRFIAPFCPPRRGLSARDGYRSNGTPSRCSTRITLARWARALSGSPARICSQQRRATAGSIGRSGRPLDIAFNCTSAARSR